MCSRTRASALRPDLAALGMPQARRAALASLAARGGGRPGDLRSPADAGSGDRPAAVPGRASANGPRNTSPCGNCASRTHFPAADIGLMRAMAERAGGSAVAGGTAGTRRAVAALAGLCGAASLGIRAAGGGQRGEEGRCMNARPPERLRLDRLATPIGEALVVSDEAGCCGRSTGRITRPAWSAAAAAALRGSGAGGGGGA